MTKEEKIKEAYGEYYEDCKPDTNGWFNINNSVIKFQYWFLLRDFDKIEKYYNQRGEWYRPKSLSGIENNNGWIKIESEADLPKDNIDCHYRIVVSKSYINEGEYINTGRFRVKSVLTNCEKFFTVDEIIRSYYPMVTHYQPIQKPELPIY